MICSLRSQDDFHFLMQWYRRIESISSRVGQSHRYSSSWLLSSLIPTPKVGASELSTEQSPCPDRERGDHRGKLDRSLILSPSPVSGLPSLVKLLQFPSKLPSPFSMPPYRVQPCRIQHLVQSFLEERIIGLGYPLE